MVLVASHPIDLFTWTFSQFRHKKTETYNSIAQDPSHGDLFVHLAVWSPNEKNKRHNINYIARWHDNLVDDSDLYVHRLLCTL